MPEHIFQRNAIPTSALPIYTGVIFTLRLSRAPLSFMDIHFSCIVLANLSCARSRLFIAFNSFRTGFHHARIPSALYSCCYYINLLHRTT